MNAVQAHPWMESFGSRELEVLRLISNGLSNREIAQKLHLSIETIKWYNKQTFMKLGVKSRTQAAIRAAELNLLDPEKSSTLKQNNLLHGNLPAQLTSYVGREKEIGEVKDLLKTKRLVMLTGTGGSGKTRLALKVAEELSGEFVDGVWLVELANVHDPSHVLQSIANVLSISKKPNTSLKETLKHFLSRRHLLLVVDNLEHLLGCAPLIGELLAHAPKLTVLGTSREPLHIYGEQEYPVYPLNLPNKTGKKTSDGLKDVESIALFIKRAYAVHPNFSLDDNTLKYLARICVRLDGLPLAIELCAPMVKAFPPRVIAKRIENNLDAIPSGPRDLPARHRNLRDTLQWSYDLLDEDEKRLFERLAVFNGGGTLQAIEMICGDGVSGEIGKILSALVNKNLVLAQERQDGEIHFVLLETIRQFGREKLLAAGEFQKYLERHAGYFFDLAKQGAVDLRGPDQIIWTRRMVVLHDNMHAALDWLIESGKTDNSLLFTSVLFEFWFRHADFEEARKSIHRVITLPGARQSPELFTTSLNQLAWIHWMQGRANKAQTLAEQALSLARSQSSKSNMAVALVNLGIILVFQYDEFANGQAYIEESKDLCREIDDEWLLARALMNLAIIYSKQKEYESAGDLFSKALNIYKILGDINFQCVVKHFIGDLEVKQNNLAKGVEAYRESMLIAIEVDNKLQIGANLWGIAKVKEANKDYSTTVILRTAGKMIFDNFGAWLDGDDLRLKEELGSARAALGEAGFRSAWSTGQNMTMNEAIEFALGESIGVG